MKIPALLLLALASVACLQADPSYSVESRLYVYRDADFHTIVLTGGMGTEHKALAFHDPVEASFDGNVLGLAGGDVSWGRKAPPASLMLVPMPQVVVEPGHPVGLNASIPFIYKAHQADGTDKIVTIPQNTPDSAHYKLRLGLASAAPGSTTLIVGCALDLSTPEPGTSAQFATASPSISFKAVPGQWCAASVRSPGGSDYSVLLLVKVTPEPPPETQLNRVATTTLVERRLAALVVADKRYIYIEGGRTNMGIVDNLERFDTTTGKSEVLPIKVRPRSAHAGVILDNTLYIFGGQMDAVEPDPNVEIINLATGTVKMGALMPYPSIGLAAATVDGKIYLIGGQELDAGQAGISSRVRIYDPATDSWSSGNNMPTVRSARSAIVYNNQIVIFGGHRPPGTNAGLKTVEAYVPEANVWIPMKDMTVTMNLLAAVRVGDRAYLFGATTDDSSIIEYNLATGATTRLKSNFLSVYSAGAVMVGRTLYLVEGSGKDASDKSFDANNEVQIFNPPPAP